MAIYSWGNSITSQQWSLTDQFFFAEHHRLWCSYFLSMECYWMLWKRVLLSNSVQSLDKHQQYMLWMCFWSICISQFFPKNVHNELESLSQTDLSNQVQHLIKEKCSSQRLAPLHTPKHYTRLKGHPLKHSYITSVKSFIKLGSVLNKLVRLSKEKNSI